MAKRTHPLRFLVTGALLVGPMACSDTPSEEPPTHNEAPPPETQPEAQQPEAQQPEVQAEAQQPGEEAQEEPTQEVTPDLIGEHGLRELNTNEIPPPSSPLQER